MYLRRQTSAKAITQFFGIAVMLFTLQVCKAVDFETIKFTNKTNELLRIGYMETDKRGKEKSKVAEIPSNAFAELTSVKTLSNGATVVLHFRTDNKHRTGLYIGIGSLVGQYGHNVIVSLSKHGTFSFSAN